MNIDQRNHRHGCSTVTERDEDDELGAHRFVTITASSVGRRHLLSRHLSNNYQTYNKKQTPSGCYTWRHQEVRPEPGVGPNQTRPVMRNAGAEKQKNKSSKKKNEGNEEAQALLTTLAELKREDEFERSVRYLKADRWFQSLPRGIIKKQFETNRYQLEHAITERQDLRRRLRIVTGKLSDNRKQIIMVSRKEEKRVEEIRKSVKLPARKTGNQQRRAHVRRPDQPILHYHNFGGRSPLSSHQCRQAAHHHTRHRTEINGRTYQRNSGYLVPNNGSMSVGERMVMNERGQYDPKRIKETVKRTNRQLKEEVETLRMKMQQEQDEQDEHLARQYGLRRSPQHFVNPPPPMIEDLIRTAAKQIVEAMRLDMRTASSDNVKFKDDDDPKYNVPTLTTHAVGRTSNEFYDSDDDDDSINLIKVYDTSDDESDSSPQRKMEGASMASVSSAPPNNASFQRFRRLLSNVTRSRSLPPAEVETTNEVTIDFRPDNITVGTDNMAHLPNSSISPMSDPNRVTGETSIREEAQGDIETDHEFPEISTIRETTSTQSVIQGLSANQSRTLIAILNHMETMSPSGDMRAMLAEFDQIGIARPSQPTSVHGESATIRTGQQENTEGPPAATNNAEAANDTDGESDEDSNTSDTSH
ncbi:MAG: hypothetical protein ACREOZ_04595, partial [Gloeomargaritales cyanobacterium]